MTHLLMLAALAATDQITLKNGDRWSGRIEKLDAGKLTFTADFAGRVTIPWDAIQSIASEQTFAFALKNGGIESGRADRVMSVKDQIVTLRNGQRVERVQPPPNAFWTGSADTGLSLARGNANTTTLSATINTSRTSKIDKLSFTGAALYSEAALPGSSLVAANARRGGFRYERNFSPRRFSFVSGDLEHDTRQFLNLRSVLGAGLGQKLIQQPERTFDIFAGGSFNREDFSTGLQRVSAEALFSEASTHKLNRNFSVAQKLTVFPNLTQPGEYRITFDSSAVTALVRWLAWQVSVSNRYISNPVPGAKTNDLLVTTGFRFNFGAPAR
jgi:putative salt-induced outer membrane protein YdiY